jgi:ribosomal protein S18 acetylase RimI-like enzyme
MYIIPEYRSRELMKLPVDEVCESAEAENAMEIRLYVGQDNLRAIKAYQRSGFSHST